MAGKLVDLTTSDPGATTWQADLVRECCEHHQDAVAINNVGMSRFRLEGDVTDLPAGAAPRALQASAADVCTAKLIVKLRAACTGIHASVTQVFMMETRNVPESEAATIWLPVLTFHKQVWCVQAMESQDGDSTLALIIFPLVFRPLSTVMFELHAQLMKRMYEFLLDDDRVDDVDHTCWPDAMVSRLTLKWDCSVLTVATVSDVEKVLRFSDVCRCCQWPWSPARRAADAPLDPGGVEAEAVSDELHAHIEVRVDGGAELAPDNDVEAGEDEPCAEEERASEAARSIILSSTTEELETLEEVAFYTDSSSLLHRDEVVEEAALAMVLQSEVGMLPPHGPHAPPAAPEVGPELEVESWVSRWRRGIGATIEMMVAITLLPSEKQCRSTSLGIYDIDSNH